VTPFVERGTNQVKTRVPTAREPLIGLRADELAEIDRLNLAPGVDEQNIFIHLVKPDTDKQSIERVAAYNERHACRDHLILDMGDVSVRAAAEAFDFKIGIMALSASPSAGDGWAGP
jgi:hypothetical protein